MPIDLRDYSRTAAQRGWGAGWPSCAGAKAAGTAVVTARQSGVRLSVHKRIARLVSLLIDETERRGYLLRAGQCGGYNCRAISGTSTASNHSWGLAVDLNWQANPYVQPRRTDMPAWLPLLWNQYGFAWGGNYGNNGTTGKADSMHFEFMGSPSQADEMTALALRGFTTTTSGDDDMSAAAEAQIATLYEQLVTGPDPKVWGWPTWPGGSNDRFTVVDYLRKQNQRAEDAARDLGLVRSEVAALVKTVAAMPAAAAAPGGPAALTTADVDRIAAAVVKLLGAKTSA